MKRVWLVQRLDKPIGNNPFAFGGGKIDGGINKEAMKLINQVFSFDYMGSAEFEWGAVPTALEALNDKGAISFQIDGLQMPVFGICLPDNVEEVKDWIINAADKHGQLKEHLGFKEALEKRKYADTLGWLKIEKDKYCEEPFMFFIDKNMFEGTCELLEVKPL